MSAVVDSSPVLLVPRVVGSLVEVVEVVAEVVEVVVVVELLEVSPSLVLVIGVAVSLSVSSSTGRLVHAASRAPSRTTAPSRAAAVVRSERPQNGQAPSVART